MAGLNSGVLQKLLQDMNESQTDAADDRKPTLLQIRSILPVLSGRDLWPNQGFYLKVSDASHVMFVSLPHEQDEYILGNKLHLGQFIYAEKLQPAYPFPLLVGVRPVPGRNSSVGTPKDLIPIQDLVEIGAALESDESELLRGRGMEKQKPRERIRSLSASKASSSSSRRCSRDRESLDPNCLRKADKDKDSDTESMVSSYSDTRIARRRSTWSRIQASGRDDALVRRRPKPLKPGHSRSSTVCFQMRSTNNSVIDIPVPRNPKKVIPESSVKPRKSSKSLMASRRTEALTTEAATVPSPRATTEEKILWGSLPANLLMLGKEVVRQRDAALIACVEALQEASTAERLLNCLSTYSELQSADSEEQQPSVDQFLDLQDDLSQGRLTVQSLSTTRSKAGDPDQLSSCSLSKEAINKIALERKKNAKFWIKAAMASDLTLPVSAEGIAKTKNFSELHEMKIKCSKADRKLEWSRGSSFNAAAELATTLQNECRAMFLGFVEKQIDELKGRISEESSEEMVVAMREIKRVSEWIDLMAKKEANFSKVGSEVEESEFEIYGRVKNKIYRLLLMHIEKTAMALESNMNDQVEADPCY